MQCRWTDPNQEYHELTSSQPFLVHALQRSVAVFSVLTIVVASFLLGYSIPLRENFAVMDQSKNTVLQDAFKDQLLAMPLNAMVLLRGDHVTNVMRYLQIVEGVRPD